MLKRNLPFDCIGPNYDFIVPIADYNENNNPVYAIKMQILENMQVLQQRCPGLQ